MVGRLVRSLPPSLSPWPPSLACAVLPYSWPPRLSKYSQLNLPRTWSAALASMMGVSASSLALL